MHITIVAIGTRGDVQPLLALALGLQAAGHEVAMIAGSNFRQWIQAHGFTFIPTVDMEAMMRSEFGLSWIENGHHSVKQLQAMKGLLEQYGEEMAQPIIKHAAATDLMISLFTSALYCQSACEKTGTPHMVALLQPQLPSTDGRAITNAMRPQTNSRLNQWGTLLIERMLWRISAKGINKIRHDSLQLPPLTLNKMIQQRQQTPAIMGFSRHVVPPPADWPANATITGYWFLDEKTDWQPSAALTDFIAAGEPPVYIGFGSMTHRDPAHTMRLIQEAVQQTNQRAIIGLGWNKQAPIAPSEKLFFLEAAPHQWLFPRVSAVVHHGGAGTTAAGLRAGRPSLIIPHMADQPYWARRVYELGVGAKPLPRHQLTAKGLAQRLEAVAQDEGMRRNAAALAQKIAAEQGVETAVRAIERAVDTLHSDKTIAPL